MKFIITFTLQLCCIMSLSQDVKYGKINIADLQKNQYSIDPDAHAVIISDIGSSELIGNRKGWFSLLFTKHIRIHILNKNGYDFSNIEIPLYTTDNLQEEIKSIKASTYNIENGKIVESKLEKENIYKEKRNRNTTVQKFTLPNVKEGSIIEYQVQITSDFLFNMQPWVFQSTAPTLWSEYKVSLPPFIKYMSAGIALHNFHIKEQREKPATYNISQKNEHIITHEDRFTVSTNVTEFRWVMKDLPAMKEEPFTTALSNYTNKIEFQLAGYDKPLEPKNIKTTWEEATKDLLKSEYFGNAISQAYIDLHQLTSPLISNLNDPNEKAKKIYEYVRENFTCNKQNQLYIDEPLKNIIKAKRGGVAEINLILAGMLRAAGLIADPIILSTRNNGLIRNSYPMLHKFNYVICQLQIGSSTVLLDASQPKLGYGKLLSNNYNGQSRIINSSVQSLQLIPDSLTEKEILLVKISNKKGGWEGDYQKTLGYYQSLTDRKKIDENGKSQYEEHLKSRFGSNTKLTEVNFDLIQVYEQPLTVKYKIQFDLEDKDFLYFSPLLGHKTIENPFKSATRTYPIDLPYKIDESINLSIDVPDNYTIEELPEPLISKLNNQGDAVFEYKISVSGNVINIICNLKINKTQFPASYYTSLRDFFTAVVNKQNQQIVFKKL